MQHRSLQQSSTSYQTSDFQVLTCNTLLYMVTAFTSIKERSTVNINQLALFTHLHVRGDDITGSAQTLLLLLKSIYRIKKISPPPSFSGLVLQFKMFPYHCSPISIYILFTWSRKSLQYSGNVNAIHKHRLYIRCIQVVYKAYIGSI